MENTILERMDVKAEANFSDAQWFELADAVADAFRFTEEERERFYVAKLAKLIAAIPFLASCEDPERTAISHLGTYILSIRAKKYANAKPSDDEYTLKRLELLRNFIGGDKRIIDRGMNLIALVMINDYHCDTEIDKIAGKHNPVNSGGMVSLKESFTMELDIRAVACPGMDEIFESTKSRGIFWEI